MPDQTKDFVAVFIDWDNIAISTAADLNGAVPDVKRIVQTAQQYGTVLVARAYAEWTATSERLMVYRAGIDTMYAPTFRYETDPVTQTSRGKSLADPCMVADCVDILHLLPSLTTFVVVSGDKDLIPVVRLAQLRGKKVVVIGPDYAAGVLREIADEFISYRKVIEAGNGRVLPDTDLSQPSRHRPLGRSIGSQPMEQGSGPSGRSSRGHQGSHPVSRTRGQEARPLVAHAEIAGSVAPASPPSIHEVLAAEPAIKPEIQPEAVDRQAPDMHTLHTTVLEILRQRTAEGKPRTRATNLKDSLMVKVPGFSERRYGFSKFKDFLIAMEKAGVIDLTSAGPVHWVSLPSPSIAETEEVAAPQVEPRTQEGQESGAAEAVDHGQQDAELVRFLLDLKDRSRWLTYTYVLTNLITHLSKIRPGQNAEVAARAVLNQLVQDGLLRVDREPQEVEVGGIRHRVRMCHIEESHPLVRQIMGTEGGKSATSEAGETPGGATEEGTNAPSQLGAVSETPPADALGEGFDVDEGADAPAAGQPRQEQGTDQTTTQSSAAEGEGPPQGHEYAKPTGPDKPDGGHDAWPEAAGIVNEVQQAILESQRQAESNGEHAVEPSFVKGIGAISGVSLEDAYSALGRIVRESTGPKKPRVGMAGLKSKLNGALGHFEEQEFGFSRFKDFLMAAEKAGYVGLERTGTTIFVSPRFDAAVPEAVETVSELVREPEKASEAAPEKRRRRGGSRKTPVETIA